MNKKSAFTLIELLVVIVIIGILASVIIISTSSSVGKAENAKRKAALSQVNKVLMSYQASGSAYPVAETKCNLRTGGATPCTNAVILALEIPAIEEDIYYQTDAIGSTYTISIDTFDETKVYKITSSDPRIIEE